MILTRVPERPYTDAELDAAIAQLTDPERLRDAQDVVMRAAPSLQQVLTAAMAEGGWFDTAHSQAVREAANEPEPDHRLRRCRPCWPRRRDSACWSASPSASSCSRTLGQHDQPQED